ncbi:peptide ABC transporter substrate-binding protein [Caloramator sp. Dgby_cultured_2]|uniref:peptide ABC transporter substrate-binding protein n=1 Tax=Caloramator sp. Dgby_cultured_2 TaxID=3029174 RepID=UPI00237EACC6|nr:peptide ABC transporter substrate-binding protein [Caloramator sp. Dgby_cultured_2]WDU82218.1 peptide ABC transporter substrate-binding protein [Caloramator sp. Dgby_cultured_2]
MNKTFKKLSAFLAAAVLFVSAAGFAQSKATNFTTVTLKEINYSKPTNMDKEQFLNIPFGTDIKTLDLSKATDTYSHAILELAFEGLTKTDTKDNKSDVIVPGVAYKYEVSKDGLVYRFYLRNNAYWTDGKRVTAQDFVYSWTRLLDPNTASDYAYLLYPIKNAEAFNQGKAKASDLGIKALNDTTLEVTLKAPTPYFISLTSFSNLFPLRKDVVEAAGNSYGQDPSKLVYNGPFTVEQWVKGSKIVLKKNPKYWDAENYYLDTVTFLVIKEEATRMQMFTRKQVDTSTARGEYLKRFQKEAQKGTYKLITGYDRAENYVFFNNKDKNKLFTNRNVRLAFSLAIDREKLCKYVFQRYYPAYGWTPYNILIGDKQYRSLVPEPLKAEKAKYPTDAALKGLLQKGLKELGLNPNATYTVTFLSSGTDSFSRTIAEFYQNEWQKKLGVKVKIDAVSDFGTFLDKVDKGDFQIGAMAWGADYNDPMTFFDMWITGGGNNSAKYSNKKYDELIKKISMEPDNNKRLQYFKEAEKLLVADDAAIAPTQYRDRYNFTHSYVKNWRLPLFANYELKGVYTSGR